MPALPLIIALVNALIGMAPTLLSLGQSIIDRINAKGEITPEISKDIFEMATAANKIARDREAAHLRDHPPTS